MFNPSRFFQRVLVLFGVLVTLFGFVFVPQVQAAPITLYDNLVDGSYKSINNVYLAQSFATDSSGGLLSEVSVMYRGSNESNTGASSSSFEVFLFSATSGQPNQQLALLGTRSVSPWSNETFAISLDSPIQLQPSTQYFIVAKGAASGTAVWKFTNASPTNYMGSAPTSFTSSNGSSWSGLTNTYFSLKVLANPPAVSPDFGAFPDQELTYGNSIIQLEEPTSTAAGSWAFTSNNNAVISITGSTASVVGAGVATVTATFTPSNTVSFLPGSIQSTFTILKANVIVNGESILTIDSETWPAYLDLPELTTDVSGSWSHSVNLGAAMVANTIELPAPGSYILTSVFTPLDATNFNEVSVQRDLIATQVPIPTSTESSTPTPSSTSTESSTPTPTSTSTPTITPTPTQTLNPSPTDEIQPSANPVATPSSQNVFLGGAIGALLQGDPFKEPVRALDVDIVAINGTPVGSSQITFEGSGLQPNTLVTVTVYSTPREIYAGLVGTGGNIADLVNLPLDLETGTIHSIVINAILESGEAITFAGAIAVDGQGDVIGTAPANQIADFTASTKQNLARATSYGVPVFDPRVNVVTTTGVVIAATSLIALAGTGGISRNIGGGSQGNGERRSGQAKLANIATKKLKATNYEEPGFGDSKFSKRPFKSGELDRYLGRLVSKSGIFSSLLPRLLVDGSWFRVLFGSNSVFLWASAVSLALVDALSNPGSTAKPTDWVLFVLILISFLDALAGAAAFITVSLVSLFQGEISVLADLRMLLGLGVLMTSLPLLVHVIRPLRRIWRRNSTAKIERFFDYVMPPVFVAFAAGSMLKALNGLSGLELVSAEQITFIRWAGFFGVLVRMFGEDIAAALYPKRSAEVHPAKLPSPGRTATSFSIVLRAFVFLFIAEPFFGITPFTVTAALLVALPLVLKIWEDDLPNFAWLHKLFPRGLLRFTITLVIGIFLSRFLMGAEPTDEEIRNAFIWLLLPNAVVGVIELFGRNGGDWDNTNLKWISGAGVWIFTVLLTLGVIQI